MEWGSRSNDARRGCRDRNARPPAIRVRIPKKKGQVGVREVRMNFKNYLDQVKGGVSFQIVQRGRVLARIVPDHD